MGSRLRKFGLLAGAVALCFAALTPSAGAAAGPKAVPVRFERLAGFAAPGTPAQYNKVGILETGPSNAKNILVLVPGTSASAAYFEPLAKDIVRKRSGWQVWAVERRENLLEDHSMLNQAKQGKATPQQLFDYYLAYLTNPSVKTHFHLIPDSQVAFARQWGMHVAVEDLHRVVQAAKRLGGRVVLGGHSLGGSITTAYATWDFNGQAGAKDLSGLVFIDGGSSPTPISVQQATQSLQALQSGSPWLSFGGIAAPYAGLFQAVASTSVHNDPNSASLLQAWPLQKRLTPTVLVLTPYAVCELHTPMDRH
jgi:pimeloyl-ACP methyl ester carboxylesterase